jgi:chromatin-remodeling ATPase INO80
MNRLKVPGLTTLLTQPPRSEVEMPQHRFKLGPVVSRAALQPLPPSGLARLDNIAQTHWDASWLRHADAHFYIEPAVAPPIAAECSSRSFLDSLQRSRSDPKAELALFGLPASKRDDPKAVDAVQDLIPGAPAEGLFRITPLDQVPSPAMRFPDMKRLIFDSAKLARLDDLLRELKAGGHRVLIYFQMTRMMSIMEEYLIYRQYKYLRLDGSSIIADRRDMVNAWQTK